MIVFDSVSKIYNHNSIGIKDVSVAIQPKEFVCVVGSSGAGKTTFLKLLIREEEATAGTIAVDAINVTALPRNELHHLRRRIGMIFQDYKLLPTKTAYENVAFALEAAGRTDEEIGEDVPQALELVGLAEKSDHFPHELSGGEKQRVAIARAFANRPDVLLADEPTGNLDPIHTWEIVKLLQKINELGATVVLASHDREIVNTIKKRIILFDKGRVVSDQENGKYLV